MGERLAAVLTEAIDDQATDDRPREAIIEELAAAAGIEPREVDQILRGSTECIPTDRVEFAEVLDIELDDLIVAGEADGCDSSDCDDADDRRGGTCFERMEVPSVMHRGGEIAARADKNGATVHLSFSSEEPYERFFGVEILGHGPGEVRTDWLGSGRAPLLVDHRTSVDDQVGVIETVNIASGRGRARVRFGKSDRAQAILERVKGGELTNASVGYRVHTMRQEGERDDGVPVFRVTDWEPLELSLVSIPADRTVGVGRSDDGERVSIPIEGGGAMSTEQTRPQGAQPAAATRPATKPSASEERTRVSEILAIGDRFGLKDEAREAITSGEKLEAFRRRALEKLGDQPQVQLRSARDVMNDFTHPSVRERFSFLRAVCAQMTGDWSGAGFEREVSQEIARKMNRGSDGIFVPSSALCRSGNLETRATLTLSNTGALVGEEHAGELFVKELRPLSAVMSLGATALSQLSKNVAIPRQTAGSAAEWVAENAAPSESTPTFDQVTLTPHQLAARVNMTRRMIVQADPSIEELLRQDLREAVATAVDAAAINGSGSSNEPLGILNATGVNSVVMGDPDGGNITWEKVVEFHSKVAADNAAAGQLAYLTNSKVVGFMRSTEKASGTGKFILEDNAERLAGRRFAESNNVPSDLTKGAGTGLSAMIYGNWADLLIGEFGAMELIVDPYTNSDVGNVRITAHSFWDIAPRRAQSFAVATDIET